jgi:crotonobetainyl-CoA:carnitine CoA-transferase CaiB-like acyl-CoA transferase
MEKPLDGIRVLDLSHFIAGPYCAMLMASMGAEVIRIEPPGGSIDRDIGPYSPSGKGMYPWHYSCNKKGITLNTREPAGREILKDLIKTSDIMVQSYLPKAKKSIGLEYSKLKEINKGFILVSFSGYGQNGPYASRGGFDAIAQGLSGMMSITGLPDSIPLKSGAPVIDYGTSLYGVIGALLALRYREKTGIGQEVDVCLLDTAVSFMETVFAEHEILDVERSKIGNRRPYTAPTDMFKAKDGYVNISVSTDTIWKRFAKLIGKSELIDNSKYKSNKTRCENHAALTKMAENWISKKNVSEVIEALNAVGVPAGPVYGIPEVLADPQIKARKMIEYLDYPGDGEIPIPGIAIKLLKTPGKIDRRAPEVGEHNHDVYGSILKYKDEKISELIETGII